MRSLCVYFLWVGRVREGCGCTGVQSKTCIYRTPSLWKSEEESNEKPKHPYTQPLHPPLQTGFM